MDISEEQYNKFKSNTQIDQPIESLLEDSLVVGKPHEDHNIAALADTKDCQQFGFDIKVLKISGTICKSGMLEVKGSVFGVQFGDTKVDLSKGEVCQNPSVGSLVSLKYCFSLKNSCLYTRGELKGWGIGDNKWNKKILCF